MNNRELGISICRMVVYTDNQGHQHAAVVSRPPHPDREDVNLVMFDWQGTGATGVLARHGTGKGEWQWPQQVPPMASPNVTGSTEAVRG